MMGLYYKSLGVGVAKVSSDENDEKETTVISIVFPKEFPPYPDDPMHDDNYDDVFISIATAKTLLIDLQDAIDAAVSGRAFK